LANYVSRKTGIKRDLIEAIGCGEDWVGLRKLVDATPGLLYRDKVYNIIDSDLTLDQKDYKLSQLKPSDIYTRLMNEMYPKLRRNDYKIIYEIRNFDLEEARRLISEHPKKLSVDEMYKVAGSYERGSKEYNYALETAVRLYPEVVAAAVNAANLALQEGDIDYALEILGRSNQADARIQAAEGYLYILKGDYDKALDLLRKAAAEGNEDAQHNLTELEHYLASI
jgi:tetratricopeptide (TPR) repeat protein